MEGLNPACRLAGWGITAYQPSHASGDRVAGAGDCVRQVASSHQPGARRLEAPYRGVETGRPMAARDVDDSVQVDSCRTGERYGKVADHAGLAGRRVDVLYV